LNHQCSKATNVMEHGGGRIPPSASILQAQRSPKFICRFAQTSYVFSTTIPKHITSSGQPSPNQTLQNSPLPLTLVSERNKMYLGVGGGGRRPKVEAHFSPGSEFQLERQSVRPVSSKSSSAPLVWWGGGMRWGVRFATTSVGEVGAAGG
jgi:hypothetical protein